MNARPAHSEGVLDLRGPLVAAAVWLGAFIGTTGSVELGVSTGLCGVVAGLVGWRSRRWLALGAAICVLVGLTVSGLRSWLVSSGPVAEWAQQRAVISVTARLADGQLSAAGRGGPVWTAAAVLAGVDGRGERWVSGATIRLSASGELIERWAAVRPGSTVRALVRLGPSEPGQPFSAWASARASPVLVSGPGPVDQAVTTVRAGLRAAVAGLPPDPRALVPALVVGDTAAVSEDLAQRFRDTGLTHLMAVSGANLVLLLAALTWAAGRLGVSGWWLRWLAVAGVSGFVVLCRAEPSVLRAAAMGLVALAALGWSGPRQGLRHLAWAVVVLLLVDPWLCRSIGFALSVAASAGIVLWGRHWAGQLATWMPLWLAEAIAVPLAAQLATQPIVTAISGRISLAGLTANLLAAPLVGPGTVLGFLTAAVSVPLPGPAAVVGWAAGGFAQALCWVAFWGSELPGAVTSWPASPAAIAVIALACLGLIAVLPRVLGRRWLVLALAAAQVVLLLRGPVVPGWPGQWHLVSCDVGQGDATVLNAGHGQAVVVDSGPDPRLVDRCLDQLGVTAVPWLVLTHLHADHAGGVAGVASGRLVGRLLYSGIQEPAANWRSVGGALPGVPTQIGVPGLVVAAGAVELEILAVKPLLTTGAVGEDSADQNDSSMVMRARVGTLTVLLAGDVEEAGQGNAVATVTDLHADVLLVPHHGSAHQDPSFLTASRAGVALISVGKDNDYGHPAARTLTTVLASGAQTFRTDAEGAIAVRRSGEQLVVTTARGGG